MKIGSQRVLDQLPSDEPCLGAVFTSYSFDPGFFEDHVLRAYCVLFQILSNKAPAFMPKLAALFRRRLLL